MPYMIVKLRCISLCEREQGVLEPISETLELRKIVSVVVSAMNMYFSAGKGGKTLFYKQPVYKQPVLRPLKNVAIFEAQKLPIA